MNSHFTRSHVCKRAYIYMRIIRGKKNCGVSLKSIQYFFFLLFTRQLWEKNFLFTHFQHVFLIKCQLLISIHWLKWLSCTVYISCYLSFTFHLSFQKKGERRIFFKLPFYVCMYIYLMLADLQFSIKHVPTNSLITRVVHRWIN